MNNDTQQLPRLPERAPDAHKGNFGHVLVVAGSPGMTGAGCMAAAAAQRAGAGLVTLGLPRELNLVGELYLSSIMSRPLPQTRDGALGRESADAVLESAERFDIFAIGPGLGRAEQTRRMVRRLVRELEAPVVVDADGLYALAEDLAPLAARSAPTILTPHPGEMSRLVGTHSAAEVQADRRGLAERFAAEHGVVLVLKGAHSVVADAEHVYVNPSGNPGMATGGMGDVLTGLVAGLLGQGLAPHGAASLAVFVHGLAGDLGAAKVGELSLTPEDVLACVPQTLRAVHEAAAEGRSMDAATLRRTVLEQHGVGA